MNTHRLIRLTAVVTFALVLFGVTHPALAQTPCAKVADNKAHVCWTAPETYTDGSPIVLAITYDVEQQSGSTWTKVASAITARDWTSGVLTPGTYVYRVRAIVAGVSSDPSNTGTKNAVSPTPNAPTVIIVAAVINADGPPTYKVIQTYTPKANEVVFVAPSGMRPLFAAR